MKKSTKILSAVLAIVIVLSAATIFVVKKKKSNSGEKPAKSQKTVVKLIDIDLTDEQYAFGVARNEPELLAKLNEYIAKIKADGTFEKICNNNFGDGKPVAVASANEDNSKQQLVVATSANFPPFESLEGNNYYGIDMEIAKGFADYIGQELVIKNMDFDAVCSSVGKNNVDCAMAALTVTDERAKLFKFTDSYYKASQKLIVKSGDTTFDGCKTKDDIVAILDGFDESTKIGGQSGTTAESYVKGSTDFDFKGLKASWAGYNNAGLAVNDMLNGNIKYVMVDAAPAKVIVEKINAVA